MIRRTGLEAFLFSGLLTWALLAWSLDLSLFGISESIARWGVLIVVVAWMLFLGRRIKLAPSMLVGIVAYLSLIALSVAASARPERSVVEYIRSLVAVVFLLCLLASDSQGRALQVVGRVCSIVTVCSYLYYLANSGEVAWPSALSDTYRQRTAGITTHPNILSMVGSVACAYWSSAAAAAFGAGARWRGVLLMMVASSMLVVVDASGSRSGSIAALLSIGIAVIFFFLKARRVGGGTLVWGGVSLAVIAVPTLMILSGSLTHWGSDEYALSNSERISAWQESLRVFAEAPLLGQGFATGVDSYRSDLVVSELQYSHNLLLTFLSNSGAVGVIAVLVLCLGFGRVLSRSEALAGASWKAGDWRDFQRASFLFSLGAILVVYSTVEGALQGVVLSSILYAVMVGASERAGSRVR